MTRCFHRTRLSAWCSRSETTIRCFHQDRFTHRGDGCGYQPGAHGAYRRRGLHHLCAGDGWNQHLAHRPHRQRWSCDYSVRRCQLQRISQSHLPAACQDRSTYTAYYSVDGVVWTQATSFIDNRVPTSIGPFAGNYNRTPAKAVPVVMAINWFDVL